MIYSSVGYCGCGAEVWIEYLWNGSEWHYRFFSEDHKEITRCLFCDKVLSEDDLESI